VHKKSCKSRKVHKSYRRARRWIYMWCEGLREMMCIN
jgi:hypothetical protein